MKKFIPANECIILRSSNNNKFIEFFYEGQYIAYAFHSSEHIKYDGILKDILSKNKRIITYGMSHSLSEISKLIDLDMCDIEDLAIYQFLLEPHFQIYTLNQMIRKYMMPHPSLILQDKSVDTLENIGKLYEFLFNSVYDRFEKQIEIETKVAKSLLNADRRIYLNEDKIREILEDPKEVSNRCLINYLKDVCEKKLITWSGIKMKYDSVEIGTKTGRIVTDYPLQSLPNSSKIRSIIMMPQGSVLIGRDYAQQDLRIFSYYENKVCNGKSWLYEKYLQDPTFDGYGEILKELNKCGCLLDRLTCKKIILSIIYGRNQDALFKEIYPDCSTGQTIKKIFESVMPGIKRLPMDLKRRSMNKVPFSTWGGREYKCDPPLIEHNGSVHFYEYLMVSTLIQGSAADLMKEVVINFTERAKPYGYQIYLLVYDEIVICAPQNKYEHANELLRDCMENTSFPIKMITNGYICTESWGEKIPI